MPSRDANGNEIYSQGEYEHHIMMGIPFTGFVDGVGYVLSEVVVTPYPINKSGTHFMWGIHREEYLYAFDENDYSNEVKENEEDISSLHMLGKSTVPGTAMGLNYLGDDGIAKRFVMKGAKKNTSVASKLLRKTPLHDIKTLPKWMQGSSHKNLIPFINKTRIPASGGASSYGVGLGRKVPFWGMKGTALGIGFSAYNIHSSGYSTKVITQEASGWTGAWIGAKLGASGGASIGASIGAALGAPAAGAVPGAGIGAAIGGFIGGIIGGIGGYWGGYTVSGEVYDSVNK